MNPADLVTPSLIELCVPMKTIVVCGYTKTGKVTIANKIAAKLNRPLFISDDYQSLGHEESLNYLLKETYKHQISNSPIIVEGILCFRLLRKGIKETSFFPDLIIKTNCDERTIRHFYNKDNEGHKIERALAFNKGLNTIWEEYQDLLIANPWVKKPKFIELNTSL
jgi:uridine kinase